MGPIQPTKMLSIAAIFALVALAASSYKLKTVEKVGSSFYFFSKEFGPGINYPEMEFACASLEAKSDEEENVFDGGGFQICGFKKYVVINEYLKSKGLAGLDGNYVYDVSYQITSTELDSNEDGEVSPFSDAYMFENIVQFVKGGYPHVTHHNHNDEDDDDFGSEI